MNARWQDTPAAVLLRLLADLMIVNVLFLLCSVPVFTVGASLGAMYAVLLKREQDEGMVAVIRTFFLAFKENFLKATALGAIEALMVLAVAGDFWFAASCQQPLRSIYTVVGTVIAVIAVIVFLLAFPQQAAYRNSVKNYLKNSAILAACAPGQLLLALAAWVVPWILAFAIPEILLKFGVIYLVWGFSFPAWVTAKLMYPVFQKTKQADS